MEHEKLPSVRTSSRSWKKNANLSGCPQGQNVEMFLRDLRYVLCVCVLEIPQGSIWMICVCLWKCVMKSVSFGAEQWNLERKLDKCVDDLWNPYLL